MPTCSRSVSALDSIRARPSSLEYLDREPGSWSGKAPSRWPGRCVRLPGGRPPRRPGLFHDVVPDYIMEHGAGKRLGVARNVLIGVRVASLGRGAPADRPPWTSIGIAIGLVGDRQGRDEMLLESGLHCGLHLLDSSGHGLRSRSGPPPRGAPSSLPPPLRCLRRRPGPGRSRGSSPGPWRS